MPNPIPCPSAEQLQKLVSGRLAHPTEDLEAHLLSCQRCCEQTAVLDQADTLIATLKGLKSRPAGQPLDDKQLRDLIEACTALQAKQSVETDIRVGESAIITTSQETAATVAELSGHWRPPESTDELGRIGHYRILKLLGAGGMGAVFLAEDLQLHRPVALKLMRPKAAEHPEAAERFLREARAAAALKHDHIVTIYQVGEEQGVPFLAMELLEGESLEDRLKRAPSLSLEQTLRIGREIAEGLSAAHAKGLIHRDIKPANIWLEAGRDRVKILDFGLARIHAADSQLTSSGMIVGTPAYMAPEQASGESIDGRADLFSLGVLLYRLTTGTLPFLGKNALDTLQKLATVTPAAPISLNSAIPAQFSDLIDRLLAKDPHQRFSQAKSLAEQLERIESDLRHHAPTSGRRPGSQFRSWLLFASAAVLALAAVWVIVKDRDGKVTARIPVPDGGSVAITPDAQPAVKIGGRPVPDVVIEHATLPTDRFNLDHFSADAIPAANRAEWFPDEVVAALGTERWKHWFPITDVKFHPSGRFFVTSGLFGPIEAWSTETLERLDVGLPAAQRALGGERMPVFTPDGSRLFGFGEVFDVTETTPGQPRFQWSAKWPNQDRGFPKVISPDGRWLLESRQTSLEVFDISETTPRRIRTLTPPESCGIVDRLCLSASGQRLAIGGRLGTLLCEMAWDAVEGPEFSQLGEALPAGYHIALSPSGNELVTGGRLYRMSEEGQMSAVIEGPHFESVPVFSPDGQQLALLYHGESRLYQRRDSSWNLTQTLNQSFFYVNTATFSPDSRTLAVGDRTGYVHVWDMASPLSVPKNRPEATSLPLRIAFSPDGKYLAEVGWSGSAVWDMTKPVPERTPVVNTHRPEGWLPTLGFSHDSKWVVFPPGVWSVAGPDPEPSLRFATPQNTFFSATEPELVTLNYENQQLLVKWKKWSVSRSGKFTLQEVTREFRQPCDFDEKLIEAIRAGLEQGSNRIVTRVGTMWRVWDLETPDRPLREFESQDHDLSSTWRLSPDGRRLVTFARNAPAILWNLDGAESTPRPLDGPPIEVAEFLPGGDRLVVSRGAQLALVNADTGADIRTWELPGPVLAIAPHPDGRHIATVTANHTVQIWRIP